MKLTRLNQAQRWAWYLALGSSFTLSQAGGQERVSALVAPTAQPSIWTPCAALAVRESWDDNVFLQSVTSNANHSSFLTTVLPGVGIAFKPVEAFNATLNYAPEINLYHSASSEDFTLHRVVLGLNGTVSKTKWELSDNFVAIDGSDLGPSYFGPGGAPAGGGPQIRDRRAALLERGQVRVTQTLAEWFVRPAVGGYFQDFETLRRTTPGYQNFADRTDWNGGADVGRMVLDKTWVVLGYRYGEQTQAKLFNYPEHYDSAYHRLLTGVEGQPWAWLNVAVSVGPEFRRYASSVPAGFNRNELYPYLDATVSVLPSKADVITVSGKRFEQPGFAGRSTYVDATYELTWRHKFGNKLNVGLGLRAYNTDFLIPTMRNDWIVTPNLVVSYAFNRHLSAEVSYLYDDAFSLVPNTQGREYRRDLAALGAKYSF